MYTGRTTRAALDAIVDIGRPKFIKLMVMVDRAGANSPYRPTMPQNHKNSLLRM